jgi:monofunctional biosynthetic peptidoglycan transglycosylase
MFFFAAFKFVPVPFTPLMVIRAIENKKAGKEMVCSRLGA